VPDELERVGAAEKKAERPPSARKPAAKKK
jgi:hypothetical protein